MSLVYIVGDNALAYYLATKFEKNGNEVFMLSGRFHSNEQSCEQIIIKENSQLSKKQYTINTSINLAQKPDFLIVASGHSSLKVELTLVSASKVRNCSVLCLSGLFDDSLLQGFLKTDCNLGYLDGFIHKKNSTLTVLGRTPKLFLDETCSQDICELLESSQIGFEKFSTPNKAFWEYFAPYAISSLLEIAYDKPIFDLIKSKEHRVVLEEMSHEMAKIVSLYLAEMSSTDILKSIYAIPAHFRYDTKKADLNYIVDIIKKSEASQKVFNKVLKVIYNKLVS